MPPSRWRGTAVGTLQLKKNAVVSSKVRNGSLLGADFKAGQLPAGPKGDPGEPAAKTLVVRYGPLETAFGDNSLGNTSPDAVADCAPGERVFGGGFAMGSGGSYDFAVLRSQPWVADGVANPTSWGVEFENRDPDNNNSEITAARSPSADRPNADGALPCADDVEVSATARFEPLT